MLKLKHLSVEDGRRLDAVYEVQHNVAALPTTLTQDLRLSMCLVTGQVTGELLVTELAAPSLEAALEKLATWCDRLAEGIREPRQALQGFPVYGPVARRGR